MESLIGAAVQGFCAVYGTVALSVIMYRCIARCSHCGR